MVMCEPHTCSQSSSWTGFNTNPQSIYIWELCSYILCIYTNWLGDSQAWVLQNMFSQIYCAISYTYSLLVRSQCQLNYMHHISFHCDNWPAVMERNVLIPLKLWILQSQTLEVESFLHSKLTLSFVKDTLDCLLMLAQSHIMQS